MAWIKRNLFFVIGAAIALILLIGAGFYTWTGWNQYTEQREKINQAYQDLKRLTENPFIGGGGGKGKVDNPKLAAEQQKTIRDFLIKAGRRFERIPAIPAGEVTRDEEYASALRLTIDQMQREATNNSVILPPRYNFSFEAQRQRLRFASGSLPPLAGQLGEVKAIVDVLNKAKINMLESIRRERISTDDNEGPPTDYVAGRSQTNELAVLTPYEITFRSFTPELGSVLAGFANSPHGIIVKSINVETATGTATESPAPAPIYYTPPPPVQQPVPPPGRQLGAEGNPFFDRYGGEGKGGLRPPAQPVQPIYATPGVAAAPKGLPILLNEKQLRVTLLVEVVKLLPKK